MPRTRRNAGLPVVGWFVLLVSIALGFAAAGCAARTPPVARGMLPIVGEKAPSGRLLPAKGGDAVAFPADFAGRAVMMSFFSTT